MFDGFQRQTIDVGDTTINALVGGKGPPLLLLHGYPETHVMWHKIAPALAERFTVVASDLRGYGDSGVPATTDDHFSYSKRATAADQVKVMEHLGHRRFMVAGHDRGARVTHRLLLDWPDRVSRAAVLDIVPTPHVFAHVDKQLATAYWHWFFLIQKADFPERLIGADPEYYLRRLLGSLADAGTITPEAFAEYLRCFAPQVRIHATSEDYRAGASIDLEHHKTDNGRKIACPLLVLWGEKGLVGRMYEPVTVWRDWADDVRGHAVPGGHFLPEEAPRETLEAMLAFFG
ncbi:alpha/beta fold hydrolase [Reyranella sp. CPCC 100927]|uniref:alpha/beta fold hydrolase n=1 Tax=Reyranella sp. CPCC 100927 TaxID=2599616 RepID=UPI0011B7601D|nr:alpha/beta hydrolase [Reyranella sp. CPCC 100927]TWT10798.1 alpha/beta hydrolase [Reyranella sp. CPCC 100927]